MNFQVKKKLCLAVMSFLKENLMNNPVWGKPGEGEKGFSTMGLPRTYQAKIHCKCPRQPLPKVLDQ